jgi:hypothetical protein
VQSTDLYSLLKFWAHKHRSPSIDKDPFCTYLGRLARGRARQKPEWLKWASNTGVNVDIDLASLAKEGKCIVEKGQAGDKVVLNDYYADLVAEAWSNIEKTIGLPLPSEKSLGVTIPPEQMTVIAVSSDLLYGILEKTGTPETADRRILKLVFPENNGSALILPAALPSQLLDAALQSVRNYIHIKGKNYFQNKLNAMIPGRDSQISELLIAILSRPLDCVKVLESAQEFSFIFFVRLCALIKGDTVRTSILLEEEAAALQGVYLVEVFNGFYRTKAAKEKEKEIRYLELGAAIARPPFLHTTGSVLALTNSKGVPFAQVFSDEDFAAFIRQKTTMIAGGLLPEILTFRGPHHDEWIVDKRRVFSYCAKQLGEARIFVKNAISKQWETLLRQYSDEPAMENDARFEELVLATLQKQKPELYAILTDKKFYLLHDEVQMGLEGGDNAAQFFKGSEPLPIMTLLALKRRDLMIEIRLSLPIWYSLSAIVFLVRLFKRRKAKQQQP